ncbi:hypothetical protein JS530_03065 [Bifidobacterium sp. LC6]|uniref:Uncharacterized protein n=1 Tax=Bifidobacterium colobi TaxID=2809026 RepID=A0ABS5UTX5_9BIFI|nr:hypothetical protein [Bifidobacterium colobi]MBT1174498.1 hypothetical protein [Bifidobacterium colobi]
MQEIAGYVRDEIVGEGSNVMAERDDTTRSDGGSGSNRSFVPEGFGLVPEGASSAYKGTVSDSVSDRRRLAVVWVLVVVWVLAVTAGSIFAVVEVPRYLARREAVAVRQTEECLARKVVKYYSGVTRIEFDGYYPYNVLLADAAYSMKMNGVGVLYEVNARPGEGCDRRDSTVSIKDAQADEEGWLGGDREAGIRVREHPLPDGEVSLSGVDVSYSTRKLGE